MDETRAYCNKCCGERNHQVLHKEEKPWSEQDEYGDITIDGSVIYEMIKCRGCENIAMRHRSWDSEDTDPNGQPIPRTTYYPPATFRKEPKWLSDLMLALPADDQSAHDLLKEIYVALRSDSLRLAVMGIRATLEHVMIQKVGDKGTFRHNMDAFETQGFISKNQRSVLKPVLEAGHATMHRSYKPSRDELTACMDVTENVIESTYINEIRAEKIAKKVPRQKKRG